MLSVVRYHHEDSIAIPVPAERVFEFLDSPERLGAHMGKSSWMMGGGRMSVDLDQGRGQTVGSHIRLGGTAFGIPIFLDEVVSTRDPPLAKTWQTVGAPKLLVIGPYMMGFQIKREASGSNLFIFIDYEMPTTNRWLGTLFGKMYAKWCVGQMLKDASKQFIGKATAARS